LGEIEREEPVQPFESFQLNLATLLEVDSRAGDKVVHHVGHRDFAAEGMAGDTRRIVNCLAEEVVGFMQRVAGVDFDSDADWGHVPPPMSTTMFPDGSAIGRPAPIAAAIARDYPRGRGSGDTGEWLGAGRCLDEFDAIARSARSGEQPSGQTGLR